MYTAIYEMTSIIAELNSEYIYESIMIESESSTDEGISQKTNTIVEKMKKAWKVFCEFVKKFVLNVKNLIKKFRDKIMDGVILEIPDVEGIMMSKLRELISDIESADGHEKLNINEYQLLNSEIFTRTSNVMKNLPEGKKKRLKRHEVVKLYEKVIYEIEDMIKRVDKVVQNITSDLKKSTENHMSIQQRVHNVGVARQYLHEFLNGLIKLLQEAINTKHKN